MFTFHQARDDQGVETLSGLPWLRDSGASQVGCVSGLKKEQRQVGYLMKMNFRQKKKFLLTPRPQGGKKHFSTRWDLSSDLSTCH